MSKACGVSSWEGCADTRNVLFILIITFIPILIDLRCLIAARIIVKEAPFLRTNTVTSPFVGDTKRIKISGQKLAKF